jgi:uncharacterized protein YjbI with pentapeptide repeats
LANDEHLDILKQGADAWNLWRKSRSQEGRLRPDLTSADLSGWDLRRYDLTDTILNYCDLSRANLSLCFAIYSELISTNLQGANLDGVVLQSSRLIDTNLRDATLRGADLRAATMVGADLTNCDLTGSAVYGLSVWGVQTANSKQSSLVITRADESTITVDNLEVAQFIYLLLNNSAIRDVIDTITSKVVLILGRFTEARRPVLDALRTSLRAHNYSPILFDFDGPTNRDITETVSTLAHLARFVIADITDAKSVPQELAVIVPSLPSVPIQPVLHAADSEYGMFEHFKKYPWVLPVFRYSDANSLVQSMQHSIIDPAERKAAQLIGSASRAEQP